VVVSQIARELEQTQQVLNQTRQEAIQVIDSKSAEIETLKRSLTEEQDMEAQLRYLQGKLEEVKSVKAKLEQELQIKNTAFDEIMEQFAAKEAVMQKRIRNLEADLKTTFKNHKKTLTDVEAMYKHEDYKARYAVVIAENQSLWAEINEVRGLLQDINALSKQQLETNRELAKNAQAIQQSKQSLISSLFFGFVLFCFICSEIIAPFCLFSNKISMFRSKTRRVLKKSFPLSKQQTCSSLRP
jgi:hypothetical protein